MSLVLGLPDLRDNDKFPLLRQIAWTALGMPLLLLSKRGGQFELTKHQLELAKLEQPLRILQLSDLHYNVYLAKPVVKAWFDMASAQEVDLVVITGDFYDYLHWSNDDFLLEQLARLKAALGVWAVWGNHDYDKGKTYQALFRNKLAQLGIRVLVNEGVHLRQDIFLAGLDDVREGEPDLEKTLSKHDSQKVCILLAHVPDVIPLVPEFVDLTLCGHTHGGQIVFPFLGITQTSSYYGKDFAEGWIDTPATAFVSRGLGYSTLPIRLNCPGEIALIELFPQ